MKHTDLDLQKLTSTVTIQDNSHNRETNHLSHNAVIYLESPTNEALSSSYLRKDRNPYFSNIVLIA